MSEGNLYLCKWAFIIGQYTLQCESLDLLVSHKNFDKALDKLVSKIGELTGDMEPQIEFAAPRPNQQPNQKTQFRVLDNYFKVSCSSVVDFDASRLVYTGAQCDECARWSGDRVSGNIILESEPEDYVSRAINEVDFRLVTSLSVARILKEFDEAAVTFVEVYYRDKKESAFFEIIPNAKVAALKHPDANVRESSCGACGQYSFNTMVPGYPGQHFVLEKNAIPAGQAYFCLMAGSRYELVLNSAVCEAIKNYFPDRRFRFDPVFEYMP